MRLADPSLACRLGELDPLHLQIIAGQKLSVKPARRAAVHYENAGVADVAAGRVSLLDANRLDELLPTTRTQTSTSS